MSTTTNLSVNRKYSEVLTSAKHYWCHIEILPEFGATGAKNEQCVRKEQKEMYETRIGPVVVLKWKSFFLAAVVT